MSWRDWLPFRRRHVRAPIVETIPTVGGFFGTGIASSQIDVDVLLRETQGLAEAAIRAISNRIATLNVCVVTDRRVGDGTIETEQLDDHPFRFLLNHPHPNFTKLLMFRLTSQWLCTVGEAYWQITSTGFAPTRFDPIHPRMVDPVFARNEVSGYIVTDANGVQKRFRADELMRIWLPDPDQPWRPKGYIAPSALTLDAHKFATEYLRAFFQYDATPKVIFEGDKDASNPTDSQRARVRQDFIENYARRRAGENQGVPRFAPPGYRAHELTAAPPEAVKAFLDQWRDDILMIVGGVPRSILGQVVSGDRSSAETNQWVFDLQSVSPITDVIADALTHNIAPRFEGDVRVEFDEFVSSDKEYELKREAQDLEHGVRTINEIRVARGEDPVEWGDQPLMATKLGPYDPETALEAQKNAAKAPVVGNEKPAGAMDDEDAVSAEGREHAAVRAKWKARKAKRAA